MLFDLPLLQLALIFSAAAVSGLISGYAGFGGGLLLVPVLVWIVKPVDAAVMAAAGSGFSLMFLAPSAAKSATWHEVTPSNEGNTNSTCSRDQWAPRWNACIFGKSNLLPRFRT